MLQMRQSVVAAIMDETMFETMLIIILLPSTMTELVHQQLSQVIIQNALSG